MFKFRKQNLPTAVFESLNLVNGCVYAGESEKIWVDGYSKSGSVTGKRAFSEEITCFTGKEG